MRAIFTLLLVLFTSEVSQAHKIKASLFSINDLVNEVGSLKMAT